MAIGALRPPDAAYRAANRTDEFGELAVKSHVLRVHHAIRVFPLLWLQSMAGDANRHERCRSYIKVDDL